MISITFHDISFNKLLPDLPQQRFYRLQPITRRGEGFGAADKGFVSRRRNGGFAEFNRVADQIVRPDFDVRMRGRDSVADVAGVGGAFAGAFFIDDMLANR